MVSTLIIVSLSNSRTVPVSSYEIGFAMSLTKCIVTPSHGRDGIFQEMLIKDLVCQGALTWWNTL